jgi:hypothetical protein
VDVERASYEAPEGEQALNVRWPRNRDIVNIILRPSIDRQSEYTEWERLDTNRFIEDVPAGWQLEGLLGEQTRIDSEGTRLEALLGLGGSVFLSPFPEHVMALDFFAALRHDGHVTQAWTVEAGLRWYRRFEWHTLALNCDFTSVEEKEDLERQLTLGEDNGLRGYEAREFEGTERLRFFTPVNLLSVYLGFAVFFDAGLVWDEENPARFEDIKTSVGFGLRFFSAEFLKRRVARIDIAFPLDPEDGPPASR